MEENVRIVVTGDNRDALKKLNKVEDAVNRLNSATKKVEVKVNGIQEAERQAARLYQALERLESAALSKLPQSLQTVIAYLKAANAGLGEFSKRAITAAAAVGDIGRVPFAPIIKAQSQAIRQFKQMKRGLVSLRVEFVRVFDRGSTQPLLDGLNLVRVSVLETRNLLEGRGDFTRPILDGLDLVKVRILEIKGLLGGIGGAGGGGRIPPAVPPNAPRLPQGRDPQGPQGRGFTFDPNTLRGLRQGIGYFRELLETAEIGSQRFRVLEDTIADLNKKLEDAQLQFQKATTRATPGSIAALREEIAAKEAAFNQTKRGTREFNELADELRRLNTELSKTERFIEGRTKGRGGRVGTALQSAALGGGFPLLFGGPSFSALGGAAGGFAGGLVGQGTGFALGIVGSAIGSAFDALTQKGLELADALDKPIQSIDTLLDALPRLDTETKEFINELRAAGLEASASAVVVEEFNKRLKEIGITDIEKFKEDTKEFKNAVKELEVAAAALAASKFIGIINLLKDGFVILSQLEPQGPLQRAAQAAQLQAELTETKTTTTTGAEPSQTQLDIQKQFNALELDSVQIQRDREALIRNSVNLSADQLAVAKADLAVAEAVNKAERLNLEYRKSIGTEKEAAAFIAVEEANTAERVARIERERLRTLKEIADVQAGRDIRKLEIAENRRLDEAKIQELEIRKGKLASFALERQLIKQSVQERVELLNIQREELLLANKGRGLDERINALFDQRVTIARGLAAITDDELRKKEELLRLERETDSIRVKTAQQVQLAQSADSLQRAQLQLDNPFGGDAYERELQRLDQIQELRNLQLQQDAQLLDLRNKLAAADAEDAARIENQIANQLQVNQVIRDEALARQEVERQILRQKQALEQLQPVIDGLTAGFTELFTSTIDGSKSAQEVVADTFRRIGEAYIAMAAKIIAEQIAMIINERILAALRGATGTGGGIGSIFSSLFGGAFADGGYPPVGKASLVGEKGPELFVPNRAGKIIPNDELGGGSTNNISVSVDARQSEVQGNNDQSRQLGTAISRAIQVELAKQQRPGGLLYSTNR